jgi:hypothetical protein
VPVCVPPCVLVPLCATGCVCLVRVGLSRPWVGVQLAQDRHTHVPLYDLAGLGCKAYWRLLIKSSKASVLGGLYARVVRPRLLLWQECGVVSCTTTGCLSQYSP